MQHHVALHCIGNDTPSLATFSSYSMLLWVCYFAIVVLWYATVGGLIEIFEIYNIQYVIYDTYKYMKSITARYILQLQHATEGGLIEIYEKARHSENQGTGERYNTNTNVQMQYKYIIQLQYKYTIAIQIPNTITIQMYNCNTNTKYNCNTNTVQVVMKRLRQGA